MRAAKKHQAASSKASSGRAFTLVEIMVVVVLIGIMTAMIIPEMRGTYENALLRSTSRELVNVFHLAYSRAVSVNQVHRVQLNSRTGDYFVEQRLRETEEGGDFARLKDVAGSEGKLDGRITIEIRKPGEDSAPGLEQVPSLAAEPAPPVRGTPGPGEGIVFYPDGTADEREIRLRDRDGFRLALRINPVTARVHLIELARQ